MKKLVNIVALFLLLLLPLSIGGRAFAQTADELDFPTAQQLDDASSSFGTIKSDDYDIVDFSNNPVSDDQLAALTKLATLLSGGFSIISLISTIAFYVFSALTQQKVAQKLGFENTWHAWVPILNVVQLFKMGDKSPWLILLFIVPVLGWLALYVITIIVHCRIAEKLGYDKLMGLLILIPVASFILWGMFAWGKKGQPIAPQTSSLNPGTLVDANPAPTILPLVDEQPQVPQYVEPIPPVVPTPQPTPQVVTTPTPEPVTFTPPQMPQTPPPAPQVVPTPQPTTFTPPTFTPPPTPVVPSQM